MYETYLFNCIFISIKTEQKISHVTNVSRNFYENNHIFNYQSENFLFI